MLADAEPEEERAVPRQKGKRQVLLIANLPKHEPAVLEQLIRDAFALYGTELAEVEIITTSSGAASSFGFVRPKNWRRVDEAKLKLDGSYLPEPPRSAKMPREPSAAASSSAADDKRPLKVRWALDRATLFVGDLSKDVTDETLRAAFAQFGTVLYCRIEKHSPELGGDAKGFGYVEYSKRSVASKVQQLLSDNLFLCGNSPRPIRVEFAVDADERDDRDGAPVDPELTTAPAHFATPGHLEFDFALKWRELSLAHRAEMERMAELHRQERELLRLEQQEVYAQTIRKYRTLEKPEDAARGHVDLSGGVKKRVRE